MTPETIKILEGIARERNIDRELLFADLEQAMMSAARRHLNALEEEEFGSEMDRLTGKISIWRVLEDGTREEISLASMGRIPAQTAKQVMIQRFREDERNSILDEFSRKQGDLITGTAARYEGNALIVQIDRAEGFMPRSEQIPGEQFQPGDRVRCMLLDVRDGGYQVKIVLSRAHPDFIRKLFEAEVPEIAERTIEIKAMAREPGFRTKLAVASVDTKVDAVGACVGVRGSRIRNIVDELGGEKIDIVRWNESSQVLIANALKPAEVEEVSLCFELGRATIVVGDEQLSLAIGRRGQNVRLAARLTGWDVDILTPQEFQRQLDILEETVRSVSGVTDEMLDKMGALGLISVFDVEEVGEPVLEQELGMTPEMAIEVVTACTERGKVVAEQLRMEQDQKAAEQAEADARLSQSIRDSQVETDAASESAADSILGIAGGPAPQTTGEAGS
ncbi:MAG: transcription termination factor NusA [Planctomycetota bacterium]|nr:transcription termination factor NusA [Planctomycetota bacterium]